MIAVNSVMIGTFVESMSLTGSTKITVLSAAANFFFSVRIIACDSFPSFYIRESLDPLYLMRKSDFCGSLELALWLVDVTYWGLQEIAIRRNRYQF